MATEKALVRSKFHIAVTAKPVTEGMENPGWLQGAIYSPANVFSGTNAYAPQIHGNFFRSRTEFREVVIITSRDIRAFVEDVEKLFGGYGAQCIEGMIAVFEINPANLPVFMASVRMYSI
jgi:hypothetical protein